MVNLQWRMVIMKQSDIDNDNDIYNSPQKFIKLINDKCLVKLRRKVIDNIHYSQNKKVVVEFSNGVVSNYDCYKSAFEHLNVAYNLRLVVSHKKKTEQVFKVAKEDISDIDIAKDKIQIMIEHFKNTKNIKLNNITLDDYFDSYEWKKNDFNKNEINEIISHLEKINDNKSKKYITAIKKILLRK